MVTKIKPYRVKVNSNNGFTETIKFEVLACGNIESNNNKFYCIELQRNPSSGDCRLFTHYGRIGKTNVYEVRDNVSDQYTLEGEYDKILKKKKRVTKGKSTYETVDTQEPSVGSENICNIRSKNSTGSSNSDTISFEVFNNDRVRAMLGKVWQENVHSITNMTTMTVTSSGVSSPLGPLTISHVENAGEVLDSIKQSYNLGYPDALAKANAKYFSMIPHPFGMKIPADAMIDDDKKFLVEFDLLEQMKSAIQVTGDDNEDDEIPDFGVDIDIVDPFDPVWGILNRKYIDSKASCHSHMKNYDVKNIFEVSHKRSTENYKNLDDRFKCEEFDLFHGSRSCNILSILMNGLMIPPSTAGHVTGRMFGDGIYGASASTKALNYATGYWSRSFNDKHPQVYMFVVKFAMGKINYPNGTRYNGAPAGYDSIWAKAKDVNLANDEFIVYDLSQAKLTHLIQLEG